MHRVIAGVAVDELRAMVPRDMPLPQALATLPVDVLEAIARRAQLPEIMAIDFRRGRRQESTEPEKVAWQRIERFANLVLAAAAARVSHSSTSSAGAGLAAAFPPAPAPESNQP